MAVRQEALQEHYVSELGAFQSARVKEFFNAAGVEIDSLEALEEAGWTSEVKGRFGYKGSKLTLAEKKHLDNYGWCRLIVFEIKEHPDLPSQSVVEMQARLVSYRSIARKNLVGPLTSLSLGFSPVERVSVVRREQERENEPEISGPLPTFYKHFVVVENQFSKSELQFSPQKSIT